MKNVIVLDNPVLQAILNNLRNKNIETPDFRLNVKRAGYLMTYEIVGRECSREKTKIITCFTTATGYKVKEKILQIIIMRAGEPLTEGGATLLDEIKAKREIGVVDARRIEKPGSGLEMEIETTSFKLPEFDKQTMIVVYDPMIATASTLIKILNKIKKRGKCKKLLVCSIIASKYGLEKLTQKFPKVKVYTLAVDQKLNKKGYIVPGLGDAGTRSFGADYILEETITT